MTENNRGNDLTEVLVDRVKQAASTRHTLAIRGGGSKSFLALPTADDILSMTDHYGVVNYQPVELVMTARAGTPLREIEQVLARNGQMLPFEPPAFADNATIGGAIASGLSGPARPYRGAARDFVLGVTVINGQGQRLRFGGEVMKNVAGFDLSRLMCGAFGTLGVLLDVSFKVLPCPQFQSTCVLKFSDQEAVNFCHTLTQQGDPVTATAYIGNQLYVRLSGSREAVEDSASRMGGERLANDQVFWQSIQDHQHEWFQNETPLWRVSLPPNTRLNLKQSKAGNGIWEWHGQQHWAATTMPAHEIRNIVAKHGGHATLFRHPDSDAPRFHPVSPALAALNQRIKVAMDPKALFNPNLFDHLGWG